VALKGVSANDFYCFLSVSMHIGCVSGPFALAFSPSCFGVGRYLFQITVQMFCRKVSHILPLTVRASSITCNFRGRLLVAPSSPLSRTHFLWPRSPLLIVHVALCLNCFLAHNLWARTDRHFYFLSYLLRLQLILLRKGYVPPHLPAPHT
jgi:hypothetical protein